MNKKELKKQFPWILKGELDYELNHVRKQYKTERGFMIHLAKLNESNERKFNAPDIVRLEIDIEWKKSRTWGHNPHAEWWCSFADGTMRHGTETASGCGYDKHSQVVSQVFNKVAKGMAWRKRNSRKKAPYGIEHVAQKDKDLPPYFEGGIGIECYRSITEFLGGKMESHSGRTWDEHTFTFKQK